MSLSRRTVLLSGAAGLTGLAGLTATTPAASAAALNRAKGASWNAKGSRGQTAAGAQQIAEAVGNMASSGVLFICIQEATGGLAAIGKGLGGGYRRVGRASNDDLAFTRLYVHDAAASPAQGALRILKAWKGPQGGTHAGREFPWANTKVGDDFLLVVGVHMPWLPKSKTDGRYKANLAAYTACTQRLIDFGKAHPDVPLLMVGDWNSYLDDTRAQVTRLRSALGARHVKTGAAIDYGIYRPARPGSPHARNLAVSGSAHYSWGSDHRVTRFAFPEV